MALLLQLRTRTTKKTFTNPSLIHLFSTSNSNSNSNSADDEPDSTASDDQASTTSDSRFSHYFKDLKNVLKQRQSTSPSSAFQNPSTPSFTASGSVPQAPSRASSYDDIRKNLSEFRRRYTSPESTPPSSSPSTSTSSEPISFQEIYNRNVLAKRGESPPNADSGPGKLGGKLSLDAIRASVRNSVRNKEGIVDSSGSDRKGVDPFSSSRYSVGLGLRPSESTDSRTSSRVIGGTGTLPASIFGKEMREKEGGSLPDEMKIELVKMYKHEELGERLRKLRPEAKGGEWFSLTELSERLKKMREIEEKEVQNNRRAGVDITDLRSLMYQMRASEEEKKKTSFHRLDILGELGRTPSFMLQPPKEHLVEKYFHPDNMSSAEKLKIELAKVREEFKMSESDCGSSRVQVALLTTKIKHLSSVLHKKDAHSRKGLLAMVQKRKRLLKYLRRTDWDSYCFVISKLGLRDNPDTKY